MKKSKNGYKIFALFLLIVTLCGASDFDAVTVLWTDNSWDETNFVVEKSVDDGPFVEVYRSGPNVTEYRDIMVEIGRKSSYRVKAVNFAGESGYSNVVDITPTGAPHNAVISVTIQD